MRSGIIALCVLAQVLVLAWMVLGRETIIATGTTVSLATAPIDPRDPFRGDFVRLRYGLNSLEHAPTVLTPPDVQLRKGDRIHAVLQERPGGLHDVEFFSNVQPDSAAGRLFLRGRLRRDLAGTGLNRVDVGYGIEQLFVEQGKGIAIEERQGVRGGLQRAMHVQVALGEDGTAVLTGYSWSALAIGIELSPDFALNRTAAVNPAVDSTTGNGADADNGQVTEQVDADERSIRPALTLTVVNQSDNAVVLNNPQDNCGFHLEPVRRESGSQYREPDGVCDALARNPVTLRPGESLVVPVDLAAPRWHMSLTEDGESRTDDVRSFLDNGEWFRLVYRSASPDAASESSVEFWQGELISQAFNALGRID